jgi:hypothetical protein
MPESNDDYGEGPHEEIVENALKSNLEQTIKQYDSLIDKEGFTNDLERKKTVMLRETLQDQLDDYNKDVTLSPGRKSNQVKKRRGKLNEEERRMRGLKEIFDFYSRNSLLMGRKSTFEDIKKEISFLNLVNFIKFLKDFDIVIPKTV